MSYKYYGYPGTSNDLGFRDHRHNLKKEPGTYRIIVLGDSVIAGLWIKDDRDTITSLLEDRLQRAGKNVEVFNFGVMGYNTQQEVETLKDKGIKFNPNLVVLAYCLNDRTRDDGNIAGHLLFEEERRSAVNRARFSSRVYRSALFRFFRFRVLPAVSKNFLPSRLNIRAFEQDTVEDAFRTLSQLAREKNFRVMVAVFPDLKTIEALEGEYPYHAEHEHIRSLAQSQDFLSLDLLSSFFQCKEKNRQSLIAFDRYHPRPKGNQCAADAIAEFILGNGLLGEGPGG